MGFPSGVADATKSIVKSALGVVEQVTIGDVLVNALTSLQNDRSLRVTRKPVAAGYSMTDAAVDDPRELVLGICLADPTISIDQITSAMVTGNVSSLGETHRDKRRQLEQLMDDREIIEAQTHEDLYQNMIIEFIGPLWDVDENWDAFFATVRLVQITTADQAEEAGLLDQELEGAGGL
jgi:hypothetical protein